MRVGGQRSVPRLWWGQGRRRCGPHASGCDCWHAATASSHRNVSCQDLGHLTVWAHGTGLTRRHETSLVWLPTAPLSQQGAGEEKRLRYDRSEGGVGPGTGVQDLAHTGSSCLEVTQRPSWERVVVTLLVATHPAQCDSCQVNNFSEPHVPAAGCLGVFSGHIPSACESASPGVNVAVSPRRVFSKLSVESSICGRNTDATGTAPLGGMQARSLCTVNRRLSLQPRGPSMFQV